MPKTRELKGLYAITQPHPAGFNALMSQVEAALAGGVRVVQYRDKQPGEARRRSESAALLSLCHQHDALLIINDDAGLARSIGADGVHVGKQDGDTVSVRNRVGSDAIIGVSCYNRLPLAVAAQKAGADYVAFGRFFPSLTKPEAVQADINLLTEAKQSLQIPVVAIGGITPENGATLIRAGADMLAVINGIFGVPDITSRCRHFSQLFEISERPFP
ncbi:thiamine phosphate synthase [Sedimenticola thiotaurini]|uniref:Thiamine-phosphate synthase n=1 Tax=Sedimenticola thiotaurini TaxID=1543721 RepID=A0A0F7JYL2_9GAMM|nr:thiamine phosphate synthase [Sedimenticola thiotaurini]AKH20817.1 thiamine-phosphate synthase [Sedimenticola thiotaurini]